MVQNPELIMVELQLRRSNCFGLCSYKQLWRGHDDPGTRRRKGEFYGILPDSFRQWVAWHMSDHVGSQMYDTYASPEGFSVMTWDLYDLCFSTIENRYENQWFFLKIRTLVFSHFSQDSKCTGGRQHSLHNVTSRPWTATLVADRQCHIGWIWEWVT